MTRDELFDEVRELVGEPQYETVADPFYYEDDALLAKLKSAIRRISAKGVLLDIELDVDGAFVTEPEEDEGVLLALFVAVSLLRGDLIKRLNEGEMGIYFRAGPDILDTKNAAKHFQDAADELEEEFQTILVKFISDQIDGVENVYGGPDLSEG